jgi:hypothetical protein
MSRDRVRGDGPKERSSTPTPFPRDEEADAEREPSDLRQDRQHDCEEDEPSPLQKRAGSGAQSRPA